ncbi:MAG: SDR family oxidoreductase [Acidobacteria bacterium]|nr:SDR family oxidoreductase [Acidobacteriota bacterium]
MERRFSGKVVWITGASSGIGEALVRAFSLEGARVVLSARREDELHRVAAGCAGAADHLYVLPLNLDNSSEFTDKVELVEMKFGPVDILINNGGIGQRGSVSETLIEVDRRIMETNYFGTIALTKAVLPSMLARKSGMVVVVSSLMGYLDTPLRSAYAASKHALQGYFDCLRAEVAAQGVDVLMVCPGFVRTAISLNALTPSGTKHAQMDPAQERGITSEKCADAILKAIASRKREVLIGGIEVLAIYLKRFAPGLYARIVRRVRN